MFRPWRERRADGLRSSVGEGVDDDQLLTDRELFAALLQSLGPRIQAYLLRVVPRQDVDDVLTEAFTTVWLRWADLPSTEPTRTAWVFGVAHNKAREHYRSAGRRAALGDRVGSFAMLEDPDDVEETVVGWARVRALLDQLPEGEATRSR